MTDPFSGPADGGASGGNRRTVVLAGALVAALAVGGGVLLLGGGSDSAGASALPTAVRHTRAPAAVGTPTPAPTLAVAPVAVTGRNPYKALYVLPTGAGAGQPADGGTGGGGAGSSPAPVATPTSAPSSSAAPATEPYPLKLVKIDRTDPTFPLATFLVDGVSTVVVPAQRFGKDGDLVLLAYVKDGSGTLTGVLVQAGSAAPQQVLLGKTITVS